MQTPEKESAQKFIAICRRHVKSCNMVIQLLSFAGQGSIGSHSTIFDIPMRPVREDQRRRRRFTR